MAAPVDPVVKLVQVQGSAPGAMTDVNLAEVSGVATAAGAGVTTAGTQRVVLASDDPLETTVKTDGAAFGTAAIGIAGFDGTNAQAISVTSAGNVNVTLAGGVASVSAAGVASSDSPVSGAPVRIGSHARTSNITAVANDDTVDVIATTVGAITTKPYSIPEQDWSYAAASGGIIDNTELSVKAAAAAGIRNYITWLTLHNVSATGTEFVVLDGSGGTVLWRGYAVASATGTSLVSFPSPIKTTAATAVFVQCVTTATQTYVNLGGYTAP